MGCLSCLNVVAATLATAVWAAKWFYKIKPVAGYLLWPYVAFLTYANCLNYFHLKENGVSVIHTGSMQSMREHHGVTPFPQYCAEGY